MVAFKANDWKPDVGAEYAVFWRSTDAGLHWGGRETRGDIVGREFALNVLMDGTVLMPAYVLPKDSNASVVGAGPHL